MNLRINSAVQSFAAPKSNEARAPKSLPSREELVNAFGAYKFHDMVTWDGKKPAEKDILGEVELKVGPRGFDQINLTAIVLKGNKMVVHQTGGYAGFDNYSQPLRLDALPK